MHRRFLGLLQSRISARLTTRLKYIFMVLHNLPLVFHTKGRPHSSYQKWC